MIIKLQFVSLVGKYGDYERVSDNVFVIRLHKSSSPLRKFLTFLHECRHLATDLWASFSNEDMEHKFIEKCEAYDRKMLKKYWEGE